MPSSEARDVNADRACALGRVLAQVETMKRDNLHNSVSHFMTPSPHSIGRDQTLSTALTMMRRFEVRHLPVLEGGRIVGLLSQRDILFVEALPGVDPSTVSVEEAMTSDVYAVAPGTPLVEVVADMAAHKYGCVVIVDGKHVVGIFTTVDALLALVTTLGDEPARAATLHTA